MASGTGPVGDWDWDVRRHSPMFAAKTSGIGAGEGAHAAAQRISGRSAIRGRMISHDANIALMAKFKPVRLKSKTAPRPQGAVGCVVLIIVLMFGIMVFLYLVMKSNAS